MGSQIDFLEMGMMIKKMILGIILLMAVLFTVSSQPLPGQRPTVLQYPDMIGEYVVTKMINDTMTAVDTPLAGKIRIIFSPNYCVLLRTDRNSYFAFKYKVALVEGDHMGTIYDPITNRGYDFMRIGTADGVFRGMAFMIQDTFYVFEKKSTNHQGITDLWLRVGLTYENIAGYLPFKSLTIQNISSYIETETEIIPGINYIEDHAIGLSFRLYNSSLSDIKFERAGRFLIFDASQMGGRFNGISLLYHDDDSQIDNYPSWSMP